MLPIVDTHLHYFDLARFHYPWLEGADSRFLGGADRYGPGDWCADVGGLQILAGVHVQAEVDHEVDPVEETAWLAGLEQPVAPMVYVAYADLRAPNLDEILAQHREHEATRGIRQEAWFDPESRRADLPRTNMLLDASWRRGLSTLVDHDLSFDLFVYWHQLQQAADVFAEIPALTVVVEHTGLPPIGHADGMREWRTGLADVATRVPRAYLKVSAIAEFAAAHPTTSVEAVLREAIEVFGPERCVFGSNYPVDRTAMSYEEIWQTYDRVTSDLSDPERSAMFAETARKVYRI